MTSIPDTAYYRNKTKGIAAISKQGGVENEVVLFPVVFLPAYPNEAVIKTIFHLDYVKEAVCEKIAGVDVVGYICGVYIGGNNIAKRNPNKLSGLRSVTRLIGDTATQEYMLLTDPLRTYAEVLASNGNKLPYPVKINLYVRSAFYLPTDSYGFELKVNGGSVQVVNYGSLVADGVDDSEKSLASLSMGDHVEIRAFASNEEGTNSLPWQSAYVRPDIYYFRYSRVDNGNGTVTFSVTLFPLAIEVPLSVTFRQAYVGSGSFTYCTVTIPAGQTTASNNMTLAGTPLSYIVQSWVPSELSDLTQIENHGEIAQKYRIKISLYWEDGQDYMLYFEVFDDDGTTPIAMPDYVDIAINVTGHTDSGAYGEIIGLFNINSAGDPILVTLNYEAGETLTITALAATSTPPSVAGREIVFTYQF